MIAADLEPVRYVCEGQVVWCPVTFSDGTPMLVPAKVLVACGDHARVVNERRILDRWYRVDDLLKRKSP